MDRLCTIRSFQFLQRGLLLVGFDLPWQERTSIMAKNVARFQASFGMGPGACASVFKDLQTTEFDEASINNPKSGYFLMALNWLATYKTEHEMAGFFRCDEMTARTHIGKFVNALAALEAKKIVWSDGRDEVFLFSVDGVHFCINEPQTEPSSKWCSHKHKSARLAYEIGISIYNNQVVWINGPFKAAKHNKTIFCEDGIADCLLAGKKAIADRGYRGEKCAEKLSICNQQDSKGLHHFKMIARACHENCNIRIKQFRILAQHFCHVYKCHKDVMEAVCILVQYDMEDNHPLFAV
jgi:DDE superfamily endonuclease